MFQRKFKVASGPQAKFLRRHIVTWTRPQQSPLYFWPVNTMAAQHEKVTIEILVMYVHVYMPTYIPNQDILLCHKWTTLSSVQPTMVWKSYQKIQQLGKQNRIVYGNHYFWMFGHYSVNASILIKRCFCYKHFKDPYQSKTEEHICIDGKTETSKCFWRWGSPIV